MSGISNRQADHFARTGRYFTRAERQCLDKRKRGQQSAIEEADRLRALGALRIQAYQCPICHSWHVGKRKQTND